MLKLFACSIWMIMVIFIIKMTRLPKVCAKVWRHWASFLSFYWFLGGLHWPCLPCFLFNFQTGYLLWNRIKLKFCYLSFDLVGFTVVGKHHSKRVVIWGEACCAVRCRLPWWQQGHQNWSNVAYLTSEG